MKSKIAFIQNVSFNDHRMVHTDGVAREMIKRGHQVDVIIQKKNVEPNLNIPYNIIQIPGSTYSIIGQIEFMIKLFFLLRKKKYDIIHTKNPFSSILPALLVKYNTQIVYDIRGLWIDFGVHSGDIPRFIAPYLWTIDLWCMRRADGVIVISNELKKELVKRGLAKDLIYVVVGDGVAFNEIQTLEPKDVRMYLGIEGCVIGYVGGIGRSRYSEKIVDAFKYVHDEIEAAKLVMIGPCKEMRYFNELIDELGLANSVFFTGFIESHNDVLSFIKSMDALVSYHQENFSFFNVMVPTKILEYLACGRSIVATKHLAHTNILKHGYNAILTKPDPRSFALGIINILKDNKLKKRISKMALLSAEKYDFNIMVNMILDYYNDLNNK